VDEVILIPEDLRMDQVAAIVLNYTTAYQLLSFIEHVSSSGTVLIHGGSGGFGTALLDLAPQFHLGKLYATSSPNKRDVIETLGGIYLNYRAGDLAEQLRRYEPDGVSTVIDGIGGKHHNLSYSLLRHGGMLIGIGYAGKSTLGYVNTILSVFVRNLIPDGKRSSYYSIVTSKKRDLRRFKADVQTLLTLLHQGRISPVIDKVYSFDALREAHCHLEDGRTRGKVLLSHKFL
jgi:NADPH:quinone reductase